MEPSLDEQIINVRNRISFFEQKTTQPRSRNDEVTRLTRSVSLGKFNNFIKSTQNLSTTKSLSEELNSIKASIAKLEETNLSKDERIQRQSEIINFLVKLIRTNQQIDNENLKLIESISELNRNKSTPNVAIHGGKTTQNEVKVERKRESSDYEEETDTFKPKVDKLKSFFEKMSKENEGLNSLSSKNSMKASSALGRSKSMHALGEWKYVPYAEMLKKTKSEDDGLDSNTNYVEGDYNETIEQEFERLAQEAEATSLEYYEDL